MMTRRIASLFVLPATLATLALVGGEATPAAAQQGGARVSGGACDLQAVSKSEAEFLRLSALRRLDPGAVSIDDLRAASLKYVTRAEACYSELYGPTLESIDDGGLRLGEDGASPFNLISTKWGAGSPFISSGPDANGPRIPGGTVTYSFMASGIGGLEAEGGTPGTSVAFSSLPTYSACFVTEITNAFAAWSAIANVQFMSVADGGQPFNAAGATGDIRIAGHVFDGPSSVLAHAYYPPPNGTSAAGDMHFDIAENWSCVPGSGIDIGIVAAHEIGHGIGLAHELRYAAPGRTALMNPFYNSALNTTLVLGDDINGAENIYGSAVGNSPDAIIDFGAGNGAWVLNYGVGWTQLHGLSPEQVVTGDLDGNGIDDIIVDFGSTYGVFIKMNNATWSQLHNASPTVMAVGDFDNSGRDDIVLNFTGSGVWQRMNNTTWLQINAADASVLAVGNIDNLAGDDVVLTFPGAGVWRRMNNSAWFQIHTVDANLIVIGDLDETSSSSDDADDVALNFPGGGLYWWRTIGSTVYFSQMHPFDVARMAAGDVTGDGKDELLVDFGPTYGVWMFNNTFTQLHGMTSQDLLLGDLDGNGRSDVLIDFGPGVGLWLFVNNTTWVQLHNLSPEGLAVGDLN
jgi:hypothetical protein